MQLNTLSFLRHTFLRMPSCVLTYTAGANGSIVGASSQVVNVGSSGSSVTAVPNANYRFFGWSDGVLTAVRTDIGVSGDIAVTANFVVLSYTVVVPLERGAHVIYAQATDSVGTVTTAPITYVMAYELTEYGIDVYSGDAKLDAIGITLHDALLPDLPTLNFSCATLLTGSIGVVIRERGLRKYQFTIATVAVSGGIYSYTCKAAESYALTTAIMALQTASGSTADAIQLIVPSLNIVNASLLAQTTYPQLYNNITPTEIIKQFMIQALAQASARNGNLYAFPLDVSTQIPDYHMQRLDPLTGWQRDADIYDAVQAHYLIKQYPSPDTVLTLNDALIAGHWTSTGTPTAPLTTSPANVTQTLDNLLPVPSGALGMLYANADAKRIGLSAAFKDFDRIRFNWCPIPTGATVTVSLQQDAGNKLELTHTFAGQMGAGFVVNGSPGVSADTLHHDISCDDTGSGGTATKFVTTVTGTTTAGCSYRVTLLDAGSAVLWQDVWASTFGNTFTANVPVAVSQTYQATTVRIEFKDTYLIGTDYGVQCITCTITAQTWNAVGTHQSTVSSTGYSIDMTFQSGIGYYWGLKAITGLTGGQWFQVYSDYVPSALDLAMYADSFTLSDPNHNLGAVNYGTRYIPATVAILETVTDYAWVSSIFVWSPAFNLFESVDIALSDMTRTGNPTNLATIALTFADDNYVDSLVLVADNPLPVTVRAGTGSRAYVVTDDFGSQAGAQAYADGLLPIISVAREQYTRDVPLSTDLSVGDTINGDGVNMTVYAVDYRPEGKTIAAGKTMDTLMTRLAEQARRLGTLERKGA